jgi:Flp pilus assembly protein TadG
VMWLHKFKRYFWRGKNGATTVEFALAAVILLTVVFGILEMSLALFTFHLLSEAAREGTRYAQVRGNTCAVNGASCTASAAQIQSFVQNLGFPGIDPAKMTVSATYSAYPAGSTCSPNANCANPGNLVTVTVVYAFPLSIPFVRFTTLSMTSTSAMVISQ